MKTLPRFVFVAVISVGAVFGYAQTLRAQAPYNAVTKYDPKRDAAQDIRDAAAEAKRTHRRVLLEVGGEWCSWCHHMDDFFAGNPDLTSLRDKNFVMLKINFSEENPNKEVLGQYPAIAGYPHLFVLDSDGTLVHSQDTSALEEGKSYNLQRFTTFLAYWAWAKEK
jgi:thiol:disulfide interchange protein